MQSKFWNKLSLLGMRPFTSKSMSLSSDVRSHSTIVELAIDGLTWRSRKKRNEDSVSQSYPLGMRIKIVFYKKRLL